MKRIKLRFARGLEVFFTDREGGIRRAIEIAEKGTRVPLVVFGPEGCGKTAWLRQVMEILRDEGYESVYVNPLYRDILPYTNLRDYVRKLMEAITEVSGVALVRLATLALDFIGYALRSGKGRVAVLIDDVFQAIGLDKAAAYTKTLLNYIEYPPREYDSIVAILVTSEGLSRRELGRHRWAELTPMWNMPKEGFRELYNQLPGGKPSFDEVWKLTGGNPSILARLYEANWDSEEVVLRLMRERRLTSLISTLSNTERQVLREALKDPDELLGREQMSLLDKLVEANLVVDELYDRREVLWIDEPPPERDPVLGIGRYIAWQTPLHREAVRRTLEAIET